MVRTGLIGLVALGLIAVPAFAQDKAGAKAASKNVKIVNVASGKVLSVADSSMDDEAAIVLVEDKPVKDSKDTAQLKKAKAATWKLEKDGDHWKVKNGNSGKVLDVTGFSSDEGVMIIQYDDKAEENDNQRWEWVEIKADGAKPADAAKADAPKADDKAGPTGRIKSKSSSLVLDADSDGTIVQRSSSPKSKSQIWQIVDIKE
jgi:hypothetical protein